MRYGSNWDDTSVAVRRRKRGESCRGFTCVSPWFIFSRLFNEHKSKLSRNKEEKKWGKEKMDWSSDVRRKSDVLKGSMNHETSSSYPAADDSEIRKEEFFNLGVGFGLVYLAAASRNELNKMVDLHKKMELLLQNFQTEFQNQEGEQHFLPSNFASYSNTPLHETFYPDHEEHDCGEYMSSNIDKFQEIGHGSDRFRREKSMRMDQLEAELEAEFDRLQLQMDEEYYVNYSNQSHSEANVEDSAPEESQSTNIEQVIEQPESYRDSAPEESQSTNIEEVIEQPEYYSVPPIELELRLHELLESRQEERINELESTLESVMQQLHEKEIELSWWKDTARLVSQHLTAFPGLLMRPVKESLRRNGTRILSLEYEKSLG